MCYITSILCSLRYKTNSSGHRTKHFYPDSRLHTICCDVFENCVLFTSIFVLVCKHRTPDTTFLLQVVCTQFVEMYYERGVLVHMTAPKFQQIALEVKCIQN